MKRIAIIPARSGSKRIPNKNIRDFCGRPIISYPIQMAKTAGIFDVIHVSTDSLEIAKVAEQFGCKTDFLRPDYLSGDDVPMMACIKYVIDEYDKLGMCFDTAALLYATSPLMHHEDLKCACEQFEQTDGSRPILAVATFPTPVEHAFRMNARQELCPIRPDALSMRTQDLPRSYYDAGMFAIYSPEKIKASSNSGDFHDFSGYEVPISRVTDIDWPEDWVNAENMMRAIIK